MAKVLSNNNYKKITVVSAPPMFQHCAQLSHHSLPSSKQPGQVGAVVIPISHRRTLRHRSHPRKTTEPGFRARSDDFRPRSSPRHCRWGLMDRTRWFEPGIPKMTGSHVCTLGVRASTPRYSHSRSSGWLGIQGELLFVHEFWFSGPRINKVLLCCHLHFLTLENYGGLCCLFVVILPTSEG